MNKTQHFKSLLILFLFVILLALLYFFYTNNKVIAPTISEPSLETVETTPVISLETSTDGSDFSKLVDEIKLELDSLTTQNQSLTFPKGDYNYRGSAYLENNDTAFFVYQKPENQGFSTSWDLYFYDGVTQKTQKIYSDLVIDCCGGDVPTFDLQTPYLIVSSRTGDECFYKKQSVFIDNDLHEVVKTITYGNDCESTDTLVMTVGSARYEFLMQSTGVCSKYDGTEKVTITGITTSNTQIKYSYNFPEPIDATCVVDPFWETKGLDRNISFGNVSLNSDLDFDLDVYRTTHDSGVYSYVKIMHIPLRFNNETGFSER